MKRGKDEEKKMMMGPLFPRLHVKDADKGGPRAPPRNKMALYEQLSVSSNTFNSAIIPNTNNHIPHPSSTQVSGSDRSGFTTLHLPPTQAFFPEKSNPSESNRGNSITSLPQVDRRTMGLDDDYTVPTFTHSVKMRSNDPKLDYNLGSQTATEPKDIVSSSNIQEKTIDGSSKKNEEDCLRDNEMVVPRRNFLISEEQSGNVQLKDERSSSDASIVDSASALDISPDDVIAVIGPKCFWKARRVIVNQQRLFAKQVFELHRLIKVQRLIAENPHLLVEDASAMIKPPLKSSSNAEKAAPGSCIPKCPLQMTTLNPTQPVECSAENAVGKPLLPTNNKIAPPGPPPKPWPAQTQPAPQGPHQWLVPVMSPTEGLIYKPCLGPTGFSGFSPYGSPSPVMSNFTNPVYGVPADPQHSYFPTYGIMPMMPVSIPGRASEQTGCFPEPVSAGEIPRAQLNLGIPKEFDSQGSTPNSPIEKTEGSKGDGTFKLFPDAGEERQAPASRVIKAVPHKPRTASESLARIIRSIQEERNRQLENL